MSYHQVGMMARSIGYARWQGEMLDMNYVLKSILVVVALSLSIITAAAHKEDAGAGDGDKAKVKSKDKAKTTAKVKKNRKAKAVPARVLFEKMTKAADVPPQAFGSYAKGCFAGGQQLAINGPGWQVMRLSRNRNWGTPRIVAFIEKFAKDAKAKDGWPGLLIGDISQPRGGPVGGHASHQLGLDTDIWLRPSPDRRLSLAERESLNSISVLTKDRKEINPDIWNPAYLKLYRRAVSYKEVGLIFVNPVIKQRLCKEAGKDRKWLRKVRPWRGHYSHFHVRLTCAKGDKQCKNQPELAAGDGCGADLAKWFKPKKKKKKGFKFKFVPKRELTLANLPRACRRVLKQ